MKITAEEILDKIEDESCWVLPADLIEEIIIPAMEEYGKQCKSEAIDETVKACAEAANTIDVGTLTDEGWVPYYIVDKQSILSVAEQLKSKP